MVEFPRTRPGGDAGDDLLSERLHVEQLPSYAPDLNPTEGVWGHLKGAELANRVLTSLDELLAIAKRGLQRIRRRPRLLLAFLDRCGLALPPA